MSHILIAGSDPEVKHSKPAPDPYLRTMSLFSSPPMSPKNVLAFEDSINGVKSALSAGLTTVWVPQRELLPENWNEIKQEFEENVSSIIYSMEDFNPEKYGLPEIISLVN